MKKSICSLSLLILLLNTFLTPLAYAQEYVEEGGSEVFPDEQIYEEPVEEYNEDNNEAEGLNEDIGGEIEQDPQSENEENTNENQTDLMENMDDNIDNGENFEDNSSDVDGENEPSENITGNEEIDKQENIESDTFTGDAEQFVGEGEENNNPKAEENSNKTNTEGNENDIVVSSGFVTTGENNEIINESNETGYTQVLSGDSLIISGDNQTISGSQINIEDEIADKDVNPEDDKSIFDKIADTIKSFANALTYYFKFDDGDYIQLTENKGVSSITFTDPESYEEITIMDRNLGAEDNDYTSSGSYGYYYQWGNNNGITGVDEKNLFSIPAIYSKKYEGVGYTRDNKYRIGGTDIWEEDEEGRSNYDELWYKGDDQEIQGPCPVGYHIPTVKEWNKLLITWTKIHTIQVKEGEEGKVIRIKEESINDEEHTNSIISLNNIIDECRESDYYNSGDCVDGNNIEEIKNQFIEDLKLPYAGNFTEVFFNEGLGVYWTTTPSLVNEYQSEIFNIDKYFGLEEENENMKNRSTGNPVRCFLNNTESTYNDEEIIGEVTNNGVTVKVVAPVGSFYNGTELRIEPVRWWNVGSIKEQLVEEKAEIKEDSTVVAFDIAFIYKGEEVQPLSGNTVSVSFNYENNEALKKAEEDKRQEVKIYHLNDKDEEGNKLDEKEIENIDIVESNEGELVVDAESFSIYTIVTQVAEEGPEALEDQLANFVYGEISIARPDNYEGEGPAGFTIMDRNLGAITDDITSTGSYGYQYQWGNSYGFDSNISADLLAKTGNKVILQEGQTGYVGKEFVWGPSNSAWTDNYQSLWGGEGGQGPCISGWHIPTVSEWRQLIWYYVGNDDSYTISDELVISGFLSTFKIPWVGYRDYYNAVVYRNFNMYRSSSNNYGSDYYTAELSNTLGTSSHNIGWGLSVRCFKDTYSGTGEIHTITFNFNGGSGSTASINVISGEKAIEPSEPVKEGFIFDGWYEKEGNNYKANAFDFDNELIREDKELFAKWDANAGTVLLPGQEFNKKIKSISKGSSVTSVDVEENNIISIERYLGDSPNLSNAQEIQESGDPVYAWFDDGVLYYYSNADEIYINPDATKMFFKFKSLTGFDFTQFETSLITGMESMFHRDSNLESINMSGIYLKNVENITNIFTQCTNLKEVDMQSISFGKLLSLSNLFRDRYLLEKVDLTNADFGNVTNLDNMFVNDSTLKEVLFENLKASNVTSISGIFGNCGNLESVNMKNADFRSVGSLLKLFESKKKIKAIDMSNLNVSSATNLSYMFNQCTGVELINMENIDARSATNIVGMFNGTTSLKKINMSKVDLRSLTSLKDFIRGHKVIEEINMSGMNISNVTTMSYMFYDDTNLKNVNLTNTDVENLITTDHMFQNCTSLTGIKLNFKNTDKIENMQAMFYGARSLADIDIQEMTLNNVSKFNQFLYNCSSLTGIDLSGLTINNGQDMSEFFRGCTNLKKVNLSNSHLNNVQNMSNFFRDCSSLEEVNMSNMVASGVTTIGSMFAGTTSLRKVDMSNADLRSIGTTNAGNMNQIFQNNLSVEEINMSGLNISSATRMDSIFNGCTNLKEVNLTNIDARNATNIGAMFNGTTALKKVDMTNADFRSVPNLNQFLQNHKSIEEFNIEGANLSSVNRLDMFFDGASNLKKVNFKNLDARNATTMSYMFHNCSSLTGIVLDFKNINNLKNMEHMFEGAGIQRIDLSKLPTNKIDNMKYFLSKCPLTGVDFSGLYFSSLSGVDRSYFFNGCTGLQTVDMCNAHFENVQNMNHLFNDCSNLENISMENMVASGVTNVSYMFAGTTALKKVDMSNSDLRSVGSMEQLLKGNTSIEEIDMEGMNLSGLTRMDSIFNGCTNLKEVNLTNIDAKNTTNIGSMFSNTTSLKKVDMSNSDLRSVGSMEQLLKGNTSIEEINMEGMNLSGLTRMDYMFNGCTNLKKVNFANIYTENLKRLNQTFAGCSGLVLVNFSGFVADTVTTMNAMFEGCTSLETLDLSTLNFRSVPSVDWMFHNASNLKTIYVGQSFNPDNIGNGYQMFNGATSVVGGNGTVFDSSKVGKEYAKIDDENNIGYFTNKNHFALKFVNPSGRTLGKQWKSVGTTGTKLNDGDESIQYYTDSTQQTTFDFQEPLSHYTEVYTIGDNIVYQINFYNNDKKTIFSGILAQAGQYLPMKRYYTHPDIGAKYWFDGWYTSSGDFSIGNRFEFDKENIEDNVNLYPHRLEYNDVTYFDAENPENIITYMDRNLGATTTDVNNPGSYGYHYQRGNSHGFSRLTNGSKAFSGQSREGTITVKFTGLDSYGVLNPYYNSDFYYTAQQNDWANPGNDDMYGGSGDNASNLWGLTNENKTNRQGPCPDGYHVPSIGELDKLMDLWLKNKYLKSELSEGTLQYGKFTEGATVEEFKEELLIPLAGLRYDQNGQVQYLGEVGRYLSSTPMKGLSIKEATDTYATLRKTLGQSLRCFKNQPADIITHSVTLDSNGGDKLRTLYTRHGEPLIKKPLNPTKPNSVFTGWYTNPQLTQKFDLDSPISNDITLYAKRDCETGSHLSNDGEYCIKDGENYQRIVITGTNNEIIQVNYQTWKDLTLTYGDTRITIMDRNLGATKSGTNTPGNDGKNKEINGYYYQWGNNYGFPGLKDLSQEISTGQVETIGYGPNNYYASSVLINNVWDKSYNQNLWGGISGTDEAMQGPCPDGYHIPRITEWKKLKTLWCSFEMNNENCSSGDVFASGLNLPFPGYKDPSDGGSIKYAQNMGPYWSSQRRNNNNAYRIYLTPGMIDSNSSLNIGLAQTIRCFKDTTPKTITYQLNSGDNNQNNPTKTASWWEEGTPLLSGTRFGYVFNGWYTSSGFDTGTQVTTNSFGSNINEENVTLYAKWDTATTTLIEGSQFKSYLSTLAGGVSNIIKIEETTEEIPSGKTTKVLSVEGSDYPVVAWFDNGTIYYKTDAGIIYLNTNSASMFSNMNNLVSVDTSNWDTSKVTYMTSMFEGCSSLKTIDTSKWDTSKVTYMSSMFEGCSSLTRLDLSSFDTSNVTSMSWMFGKCSNLKTIYASSLFDVNNVTTSRSMFLYADQINGGNGTKLKNVGIDDKTYAKIDTQSQSGYFTDKNREIKVRFVLGGEEYYSTGVRFGDKVLAPNTSSFEGFSGWYYNGEEFDFESTIKEYTELYAKGLKSPDTTLLPGQEFNIIVKNFINNGETYKAWDFDNKLKRIYRSETSPEVGNTIIISSDNSANEIIAWFEDETLYYYTPADVIYLDQSSSYMFANFSKLSDISGLSGWDTSKVTNMGYMFSDCNELSDISGLSGWDTSKVTNMSDMFDDCYEITDISGLSGWDTSKVTNMSYMFSDCDGLVTVDLSNWNTSNVTDMEGLFGYSTYLKTVNLSGWNTSKVTNMSYMFDECDNLITVNLSNWNTSNVTTMEEMFGYCYELTDITSLSGWDTSKVTNMDYMFMYCYKLKDISSIERRNTSSLITISEMFEDCYGLKTVDLSNWDTSNIEDMSYLFYECNNIKTIDLSNWDTSKVKNMNYMFDYCGSLQTIYASPSFVVNEGTYTSYMLYAENIVGGNGTKYDEDIVDGTYAKLDTQYQSGYFTDKESILVRFMSGDIEHARELTNYGGKISAPSDLEKEGLIFSGWHTKWSKISFDFDEDRIYEYTEFYPEYTCGEGYILKGDKCVEKVIVSFNTNGGTPKDSMITEKGTKIKNEITKYSYTENLSYDGTQLTSYSNFWGNKNIRGTDRETESDNAHVVSIPGVDSLKITVTYGGESASYDWVSVWTGNHPEYTAENNYDMAISINGNQKLGGSKNTESIIVSGNTVTFSFISDESYAGVGYGYYAVIESYGYPLGEEPIKTGYNFIGWYTEEEGGTLFDPETTDIDEDITLYAHWEGKKAYLKNVSALKSSLGNIASGSLSNVYHFERSATIPNEVLNDTSKIISADDSEALIYAWFEPEVNRGTLYYYSNAPKVFLRGNVQSLFNSAWSNIKTLDLSDFDTSEVTNMYQMFYGGCNQLTGLNISGWNTSNVTNMAQMFRDCKLLEKIDVGGFDTSKVTDMSYMFQGSPNLTGIDVKNFNTNLVTNMSYMFQGCTKLKELDVSLWNTSRVNNMSNMFGSCNSLLTLDVSNWDTENVTNMSSMFGLPELINIDLSKWNTSNVTNMYQMFYGAHKITSLDISGWDTSKVTNMAQMFRDCYVLENLNISNWNTSQVGDMSYMFDNNYNLTGLDLSKWNTSRVNNMSNMFESCRSLEFLDLKSFDTSNVTKMNVMFNGCSSLTELDISNFSTPNLIETYGLFRDCRNLRKINMINFDTRKVSNFDHMFYDNRNLETIYVGDNFSKEKLSRSVTMFFNDSKLRGGMGTSVTTVDGTYAQIDSLTQSGYFTNPNAFAVRFLSGTKIVATQIISTGGYATGIIDNTKIYSYYTDSELNTPYDFSKPLYSYTEIYTTSIPAIYTVIYDAESHSGTISNQSTKVVEKTYNTAVQLTGELSETAISQKSGYQFIGWTTKLGGTEPINEYTITRDITFYPIFKKDIVEYTAVFSGNGSTLIGDNHTGCIIPVVYNTGDQPLSCNITTPNIQRTGYEILGFDESENYEDICSIAGSQEITIDSNTTYYAITKKELIATFDKNGNDAQKKAGEQETTDQVITEKCTLWNKDIECSITTPEIINPSKNIIGYSRDVNNSGDRVVNHTTNILISETPISYFAWSKSIPETYNVIFTGGYGIESISKETDSCTTEVRYNGEENATGCKVELPEIVIKYGYRNPERYNGITAIEVDDENNAFIDSDKTLTAKAQLMPYVINVESIDENKGSVQGSGIYEYYTYATIKAIANSGYAFSGWKVNGELVSTDKEYQFRVEGPKTLQAEWKSRTDTKYSVEIYEQENGTYPEIPSRVIERAGTTDEIAEVEPGDKEKDGYLYDESQNNIESTRILPNGDGVLKIYLKKQYEVRFSTNSASGSVDNTLLVVDYGTEIIENDNIITVGIKDTTATSNERTDKYTHTFSGWSTTCNTNGINESCEIVAEFISTINKYKITFVDEDGVTPLWSGDFEYETNPIYGGSEPTKAWTPQYTYEFSGWNPKISTVHGEKTYTAVYRNILNTYTVTWKNSTGTELEVDENVPYGNMPTYDGAIPTSGKNAQYTYEFSGWIPNTGIVVEDVIYTASYKSIVNEYPITWIDGNGNELKTDILPYGAEPKYEGETPTKTRTAQYTYTFNNTWLPEIESVKTGATYTAQFGSEVNQYQVNIFSNDEEMGAVDNDNLVVDYGTEITENGNVITVGTEDITATPNQKDAQYTYIFDSWKNDCGDEIKTGCNITAIFDKYINSYMISFNSNGGSAVDSQRKLYGEKVSKPTNPNRDGYTFRNWYYNGVEYDFSVDITTGFELDAEWNAVSYDIDYNLNGGTNNANNPDNYTIESDDIILGEPSREGYTFEGWSGTEIDGISKTVEIANGSTGNRNYEAIWKTINYEIEYVLNDGINNEHNPITYTIESGNIELNEPSREGYVFEGWSGTDVEGTIKTVVIASGSIGIRVYEAIWETENYEITYNLNGGTEGIPVNPRNYTIESGDIELTHPTREGYTFEGWSGTDVEGISETVVITSGSIGNRVYEAVWSANTYQIQFYSNNGENRTEIQEFEYDKEETLRKNIFEKTGYTFTQWNTEAEGNGTSYDDEEIIENLATSGVIDVYAQWRANNYSVRYHANQGSGEDEIQNFVYDEEQSLRGEIYSRTGYNFLGWNTLANGEGTNYTTGQIVENLATTGEVDLYAQWGAKKYTVTYVANLGEGDDIVDEVYYDANYTINDNTFKRTGYTFSGWNTKANGEGQSFEEGFHGTWKTANNIILYAIWDINYYTVIYDAGTHSGVINNQATKEVSKEYKTLIPLTGVDSESAISEKGYSFIGWTTEQNGTGVIDEYELTGNTTFYPVFKKNPVEKKITFYLNGNSGFTYNEESYYEDKSFNLCTIPARYNTDDEGDCSAEIELGNIIISDNTPNISGWSTTETRGERTDYEVGTRLNITVRDDTVTEFYAQTYSLPIYYTVYYDYGTGVKHGSTTSSTCKIPGTNNGVAQSGSCNIILPLLEAKTGYVNPYWYKKGTEEYITTPTISISHSGDVLEAIAQPRGDIKYVIKHYFQMLNNDGTGLSNNYILNDDFTFNGEGTGDSVINLEMKKLGSIPEGFHYWKGKVNNEYIQDDIIDLSDYTDNDYDSQTTIDPEGRLVIKLFYKRDLYTITWMNGETELGKTLNLPYGVVPVYSGIIPTKSQTPEFTYEFANSWTPEIHAANSDETYYANYNATKRSYTITWIDEDNSPLTTTTVLYGDTPEYPLDIPKKVSDSQYHYIFDSWTPEIIPVNGTATYKAQYSSQLRSYLITWKDGNGKVIQSGYYDYGTTPDYEGEIPTKTSTAQTGYEFNGSWNPSVISVQTGATYMAQFYAYTRKYPVVWLNENDEIIKETEEYYGTNINTIKPDDQEKASTIVYDYTFDGWYTGDIKLSDTSIVQGSTVYKARFNAQLRSYPIWFKNYDGEVLQSGLVLYGTLPVYTGTQVPSKPRTQEYSYEFNGWTPGLNEVGGEAVYTAVFKSIKNKYPIQYLNEDGSVLWSGNIEYGDEVPSYNGTPTKQPTEQTGYSFNGWTPTPTGTVTGPQEYRANYTEYLRSYEVKTIAGRGVGSIEGEGVYEYGEEATITGTAKVGYHFGTGDTYIITGVLVTGDIIIRLTAKPNHYIVEYLSGESEGTMEPQEFAYDEPERLHANTYTKQGYKFNGWKDEKGTIYTDKQEVVKLATTGIVSLIAQWKKQENDVIKTQQPAAGGGRLIKNIKNNEEQEHNSAEENNNQDNTQGTEIKTLTSQEQEILSAYEWAYKHNVTTMPTLEKAMPDGVVKRGHLAKMVVNYATNVLGREIPEKIPSECRWNDGRKDWESEEIKDYAVKSCALGLMGLDMPKFLPNMEVTRAQFGTIMSRLLWGKKYAGGTPYYRKHLNALKENGIMTQIENPEKRVELRQWVWVMLMRSADNK